MNDIIQEIAAATPEEIEDFICWLSRHSKACETLPPLPASLTLPSE